MITFVRAGRVCVGKQILPKNYFYLVSIHILVSISSLFEYLPNSDPGKKSVYIFFASRKSQIVVGF